MQAHACFEKTAVDQPTTATTHDSFNDSPTLLVYTPVEVPGPFGICAVSK